MPTTLLSATDYQNSLRESALSELVKLSNEIFSMKYEVSCIYQVKDNYSTEIDTEIQSISNYFNFTNEWRFFYLKNINWHGSKLKYLLASYLDTIFDNEYLFLKVNLDKVFTNKYFIDTIEIKGSWLENPVGLESRYKILYNLIQEPNINSLEIHCNICGINIPLHGYLEAHDTSLHCPHHHHLIYDPVADMEHSHLACL